MRCQIYPSIKAPYWFLFGAPMRTQKIHLFYLVRGFERGIDDMHIITWDEKSVVSQYEAQLLRGVDIEILVFC